MGVKPSGTLSGSVTDWTDLMSKRSRKRSNNFKVVIWEVDDYNHKYV